MSQMHVAVVGAGLAGLCAAYYLRQAGAEVTVFDRADAAGTQTSSLNGSLLHPSFVEPWNRPGVWRELLQSLGNEEAAVLLRPRELPGLLGWGAKFLLQSQTSRFLSNARANLDLAVFSLELMQSLKAAGVQYDEYARGSLSIARSKESLDQAVRWRRWLAQHGLPFRLLSRDELLVKEPALIPVADQLVGGTFQPQDEGGDPQLFCRAVERELMRDGVRFRYGCEVDRVISRGWQVTGVRLRDRSIHEFDAVVLCSAAWSAELAESVGLTLPIRPVKGYSLTLPRIWDGQEDLAPKIPVIDTQLHVAIVPVGADRVRVAGTAEFAGFDLSVRPERVENLRRLMARLYPRYMQRVGPNDVRPWTGLRPVTPDGVALIGPSRLDGLFMNTGHGHTGWTTAAAGGHMVAAHVLGKPTLIESKPYDPRRFRYA